MIYIFSSAYLCCTKCRYSSCCAQALKIHTSLFHGPRAPFYNLGHPSILKENVFCVCGFNTNSGNKIGKLLLKVRLFFRRFSIFGAKTLLILKLTLPIFVSRAYVLFSGNLSNIFWEYFQR